MGNLRTELVKVWERGVRAGLSEADEALIRLESVGLVMLIPQAPHLPWVALVADSLGSLQPTSPQQRRVYEIDGWWPTEKSEWLPLAKYLCFLLKDFGLTHQSVWVFDRPGYQKVTVR